MIRERVSNQDAISRHRLITERVFSNIVMKLKRKQISMFQLIG